MALKPIDPGPSATDRERGTFGQAQEHARRLPHLWANGPEHQMTAKPSRTSEQTSPQPQRPDALASSATPASKK
jgi:hypothetical protein